MNVLLLSLLYPKDSMAEVQKLVRDKVQNQINAVQHALCDGLRGNLQSDETLTVVNALPVGVYPKCYRKMRIPSGMHDAGTIYELGCMNLPLLKQKMRQMRAKRAIMKWAEQSTENRTVLIYTIYLPYLKAILAAKKHFPNLKAVVLVTDLPNQYGLDSGRSGLLKQIETHLGNETLQYASQMDAFILMTQAMSDVLQVGNRPAMIMEGIIQSQQPTEKVSDIIEEDVSHKPVVLYTGTLEPDLGIGELVRAFQSYRKAELWLCGTGSMQQAVAQAAEQTDNIRYFGAVAHQKALNMQQRADLLINPRRPDCAFTRYSFPSKTLEYMLSGTPVLCYRLEGIPQEYDAYLHYMDAAGGAEGITEQIDKLLFQLPKDELADIAENGREFVLTKKNAQAQGQRVLAFLRTLG